MGPIGPACDIAAVVLASGEANHSRRAHPHGGLSWAERRPVRFATEREAMSAIVVRDYPMSTFSEKVRRIDRR